MSLSSTEVSDPQAEAARHNAEVKKRRIPGLEAGSEPSLSPSGVGFGLFDVATDCSASTQVDRPEALGEYEIILREISRSSTSTSTCRRRYQLSS